MDARQNLRFIARLNRIPDGVSDKRIDELLEQVGLFEEAKKKVGTYSKGMRQTTRDRGGPDQGTEAHLPR